MPQCGGSIQPHYVEFSIARRAAVVSWFFLVMGGAAALDPAYLGKALLWFVGPLLLIAGAILTLIGGHQKAGSILSLVGYFIGRVLHPDCHGGVSNLRGAALGCRQK
jgi:hypothetical protein